MMDTKELLRRAANKKFELGRKYWLYERGLAEWTKEDDMLYCSILNTMEDCRQELEDYEVQEVLTKDM